MYKRQKEDPLANELSEVTRRAIVDFIVASEIDWAGRLGEDDFLALSLIHISEPTRPY